MALAVLLVIAGGRSFASEPPGAAQLLYGKYCASCHGVRGEGAAGWREPNEKGELPAPPHDSSGHTWRHADAVLYEMIAEGWRDPFNKTETLTMPAFGAVLTPKEIADVVAYLKTLWTPEQRQFQSEESRDRPLPPVAN